MACAADTPRTSDNSISEPLKCPICLDVYKTPRVLNCLHTFCEPCIQSMLTKGQNKGTSATGILCPLCRTETAPPCPNKPRAEWAGNLLLHEHFESLLTATEHEKIVHFCDPCVKVKKTIPAICFCKGCRHYQCEECNSFHLRFPGLDTHHVIKIEEIPTGMAEKLTLGQIEYCPQHPDREVELYCEDDKKLCCFECLYLYHRSCKHLKEVAQLGRSVKEGDRPQVLETQMEAIQTQVGEVVSELEKSSSTLENQAVDSPQKMKDIRNKLVNVLDQLVIDVTADCGQLKKQHTTELDDKITSMKSLEAAIMTSRSFLGTLIKHGTEKQIFLVIQKLEEQVTQYSKQLTEAQPSMEAVELHLTISDDLGKILQTTQVLARVTAVKKHVLIAECTVEKLPLIQIQKRAKLQQPGYTGAEYFPDGRLVAVDRHNCVCCLMDDHFTVMADVKLPSNPIDVCVIGPTEVVVTLHATRQLQRVSVVGNSLTLTATIPCSRVPYSVSRVSDTELAVGWDMGIGILSVDGQEKMYIDRDKSGRAITFSEHDRIVADVKRSRFYRSRGTAHAVDCMGFTGDVHFTYTNKLQYPYGLALDRDGNVYICSYSSNTVHQVSPTGQTISVIPTGMSNPYTVCFNTAGDQMTVINYACDQVLKVRFEAQQTGV